MKEFIMKLYAEMIAGFYPIDELEEFVAEELGMSKDELASKYAEIATKLTKSPKRYHSDLEFRQLMRAEYLEMFGIKE